LERVVYNPEDDIPIDIQNKLRDTELESGKKSVSRTEVTTIQGRRV
jgi:hypothetical protein